MIQASDSALSRKIVICSFFTDDTYYSDHAEKLRATLDDLGIEAVIRPIQKRPGEEWPDICRKKIPFIKQVCDEYPDRLVFWIDVDCRLMVLPSFLAESSADLIGFQRGFGAPMKIGYQQKSRFWEPCFFGISPSVRGRSFIETAAMLEADSDVRATDDYFFEEAWRLTNANLSFQIIPSGDCLGPGNPSGFFQFGASGNVPEFKGKVKQHSAPPMALGRSRKRSALRRLYRFGLAFERKLPRKFRLSLNTLLKKTGLLDLLGNWARGDKGSPSNKISKSGRKSVPFDKNKLELQAVSAAIAGEEGEFASLSSQLRTEFEGIKKSAAVEVGESFLNLRSNGSGSELQLSWWSRPFPGNFGDWLSPYIFQSSTNRPVVYVNPNAANARGTHIVGLGSIARTVGENSIVFGTGVSSSDQLVNPQARYFSVRGPITAKTVQDLGGPVVDSHGDPGVLMRRLYHPSHLPKTEEVVFVRHFAHQGLPVQLPDHWIEQDILRSGSKSIEELIDQMYCSKGVVTSAMHIFIVCQSYGIPSRLVTFRNFEELVHGSGEKYLDYHLGSDQDGTFSPSVVGINLRNTKIESEFSDVKIPDVVLDRVEGALVRAVEEYDQRVGG